MPRPDCKECPSSNPQFRYDARFPDACPLGPANSIKLLGNVCPAELGVGEIRKRCANFDEENKNSSDPLTTPCLADDSWQAKRLAQRTTCMVGRLEDLRLCYGYKPRKN